MQPLTVLPTVEQNLVNAIDAAAATLDTVATSTVDAAMARLQSAADAARDRINSAMARLQQSVAGVVGDLNGAAVTVYRDLSTDAFLESLGTNRQQLEQSIPAAIAEATTAAELPTDRAARLGDREAFSPDDYIDLAEEPTVYPDPVPSISSASQIGPEARQDVDASGPARTSPAKEIAAAEPDGAISPQLETQAIAACSSVDPCRGDPKPPRPSAPAPKPMPSKRRPRRRNRTSS